MSAEPDLVLADVDRDGALAETLVGLGGVTRADVLRGAALGGATLLAAAATPAAAGAAGGDDAILRFALTLEELQAAFYTEVERNRVLHGGAAAQAHIVGAHE